MPHFIIGAPVKTLDDGSIDRPPLPSEVDELLDVDISSLDVPAPSLVEPCEMILA